MVCVTGTNHPPNQSINHPIALGNVQGGVLVNVQEWGCFSIFWRADDVTRTMSKGGGGGVLVNVFTSPFGKAP